MSADEIPDTIFGTSFQFEAFLQATVGLISGDDQILLDSTQQQLSA